MFIILDGVAYLWSDQGILSSLLLFKAPVFKNERKKFVSCSVNIASQTIF